MSENQALAEERELSEETQPESGHLVVYVNWEAATKAKAKAREAARAFGVTFRDEDVHYEADGSRELPFERIPDCYFAPPVEEPTLWERLAAKVWRG